MAIPGAGRGGELSIQARVHVARRWFGIVVPLEVGGGRVVFGDVVLDTGSPISSISEGMRDVLEGMGLLTPVGRNRYLLRQLTIQGQPIPDLEVRVSQRVATEAEADGILGLDFLTKFEEIRFHVPSLRLTLKW